MKNINKSLLLLLIFAVIFSLFGCSGRRFKEDDIIGLTSAEIIEKYGEFDRPQGKPGEDGLYRNCACGYLISEAKTGYLGTTPPEYFMITFDENGIACYCRYEKVV
ncbi:MAG: hypothetical protein IKM27_03975 [Clostridia bacterium]|nr:hypothetical protein [Clostridia bacterium]